MAKNYYRILGILPTATSEDIRGAYRKRAKELHPDHYGENSSPFLEVQEAYGVLRDPEHRQRYDRSIRNRVSRGMPIHRDEAEPLRQETSRPEPLRSPDRRVHLGGIRLDSFRTVRPSMAEILDRLRGNFDFTPSYKSERLRNLCLEIVLTPEEARLGGRMEVVLPSRRLCLNCGGSGSIEFYECSQCAGGGAVYGETPVIVVVPPGVLDGSQRTISLRHLGIRDVYVSVLFRVSRKSPMEDL
jgi:molecular chaperone DnaJ